jgi:hypothetical protein
MFAESSRSSRVDAFSQIQRLGIFLSAQRGQHPLRSEGRFVQPNADRIVDGVGNRGNGCGQRTFAAFLGAERALRIDALDDNRLDFRRLDPSKIPPMADTL